MFAVGEVALLLLLGTRHTLSFVWFQRLKAGEILSGAQVV